MNFVLQRTTTNQLGVFNSLAACRGIHDVGIFAVFQPVLNMWTTFVNLVNQARINARFPQHHGGAMSGIQLKAKLLQLRGQVNDTFLIALTDRQQRASGFLHVALRTQHRFGKGLCKGTAHAHDFTG